MLIRIFRSFPPPRRSVLLTHNSTERKLMAINYDTIIGYCYVCVFIFIAISFLWCTILSEMKLMLRFDSIIYCHPNYLWLSPIVANNYWLITLCWTNKQIMLLFFSCLAFWSRWAREMDSQLLKFIQWNDADWGLRTTASDGLRIHSRLKYFVLCTSFHSFLIHCLFLW